MKARLAKAIAAVGATLYEDSDGLRFVLSAHAPLGSVWAGDFIHEMVVTMFAGCGTRDAARREMLARVKDGVVPCETPECEWCTE